MAYSTHSDVRLAIVPGLSDPDAVPDPLSRTAADLSNPDIDSAIEEADARINIYLGARYAIPVTDGSGNVPAVINLWSRNFAAYLCLLTWRKNQNVDPNDPLVLRYNGTLAELTAVRDGKASLPFPDADGQSGSGGGGDAINMVPCGLMGAAELDIYGYAFLDDIPRWPAGVWFDR